MVYYELMKFIIDVPGPVEVIIEEIIRHYNFADLIVADQSSVFTLKFSFSLCYFLQMKQKLSTAFDLQTDGQIEKQISTMEIYFWAFVNFE